MHLPAFLIAALLSLSPLASAAPAVSESRCGSAPRPRHLSKRNLVTSAAHKNYTTPTADNWIEIPLIYHNIACAFPAAEFPGGFINDDDIWAQVSLSAQVSNLRVF